MNDKPSIDKDLIRELAGLLDETGLTEIEVTEGKSQIRVARAAAPAAAIAVPAPVAAPVSPAARAAESRAEAEEASHPGAVTSPMVGTAYIAPEPGSAPFVKVGDEVSEGQTLLFVEAMKTMNPIPAPKSGRVTQILFSDGAPVEYGEILLIIE